MSGDALSDLVLAVICLGIAQRLMATRPAFAVGALMIGLAATAGILRFSGVEPALGPHRFFSLLAACTGFPLLAVAVRWPDDPIARHVTAAGRFVLIAGAIGVGLTVAGVDAWRQVIPALSVMAITLTAFRRKRPADVLGAGCLIATCIIAAVGRPADPMIGPLSNVQWLHYLMAVGLLCLGTRKPAPPLFSPAH